MVIHNNVLKEVTEEDIIDGVFNVPENIKTIESFAFGGCFNLKTVNITDGVTSICDFVFFDCLSLMNVNMAQSIEEIGNSAFIGCSNLTNINIPNKITEIKNGTFSQCFNLKDIKIPEGVTKIGKSAFDNCTALENVTFPSTLKTIDDYAFSGCTSLTEINIPEEATIGKSAFSDCLNLTKINIPYSVTNIKEDAFESCGIKRLDEIKFIYRKKTTDREYVDLCEYLYEHLSFVKKIKMSYQKKGIEYTFKHFKEDLLKCFNEKDLLYYFGDNDFNVMNDIDVFEIESGKKLENKLHFYNYLNLYELEKRLELIYPKTRFFKLPSLNVVLKFDLSLLEKFDLKLWDKYSSSPLFEDDNSKEALVELIAIFDLFNKNSNYNERVNLFEKIFYPKTISFTKQQLDIIIENIMSETLSCEYLQNMSSTNDDNVSNIISKMRNKNLETFKKALKEGLSYEYKIKDGTSIPLEFKDYLDTSISEKQRRFIKKIGKSFGKRLNDFINKSYEEVLTKNYILDCEKFPSAYKIFIKKSGSFFIAPDSLHRMFDGNSQTFSEDKMNFIIDNWEYIIKNPKNQSILGEVLKNFEIINNYYLAKGNTNFNYIDALTFLKKQTFKNIEFGNEQFAALVKNAGVNDQETFEFYQKKYKEMRKRETSTIPNYNKVHEIELAGKKYKIKTQMLDLKDPFALLVGEAKYTNCCQVYGNAGENCMKHAIKHGRIFCVYIIEDGISKLLSQSWTWTNGNLLCFDNIEGTDLITLNNKKTEIYRKLTAIGYKFASDDLMSESKKQMEETFEKMNLTEEEKQRIRKNQIIKSVTVGESYNDLNVYKYFPKSKISAGPKDYYGYRDSNNQRLISGTDDITFNLYPEIPIYSSPREIISQKEIEDSIIRDLNDLDGKSGNEIYEFLEDYDNLTLIKGNDWYILYDEDDEIINIINTKVLKPRLSYEKDIQEKEYKDILKEIIKSAFIYNEEIQEYEMKKIIGISIDENLLSEVKEELITNEPDIDIKNTRHI